MSQTHSRMADGLAYATQFEHSNVDYVGNSCETLLDFGLLAAGRLERYSLHERNMSSEIRRDMSFPTWSLKVMTSVVLSMESWFFLLVSVWDP